MTYKELVQGILDYLESNLVIPAFEDYILEKARQIISKHTFHILEPEDLKQEFFILLKKREHSIKAALKQNPMAIKRYITTTLLNLYKDILKNQLIFINSEEKRLYFKREENYTTLTPDNCSDPKAFLETYLANTVLDPNVELEEVISKEIQQILQQQLSDKEWFSLCIELGYVKVKKDYAHYKRIERVKVKLRKIFNQINATSTDVEYFLKTKMPRLCKKFYQKQREE
jgi:predicted nucleic acid-binding Zn finger protein